MILYHAEFSAAQTSFLRPNLLFRVVPKVREADQDADQPLYMTNLIKYIKAQQAAAAAAAASSAVKPEPGTAAAAAVRHAGTATGGSSGSSSGSCSGIIYCLSRKEAEGLANYLRQEGVKAGHYHAGMTPKQRMEVSTAQWFSLPLDPGTSLRAAVYSSACRVPKQA
jgi:superfamily II DNA helicase RecQ